MVAGDNMLIRKSVRSNEGETLPEKEINPAYRA
jgi:hypothetical protein